MERLGPLLKTFQSRVERALDTWLPSINTEPQHLHEAMRYGVLGGGKRIRPVLVYAAGQIFDIEPDTLDAPACAVELIHAYSLIHDDLPSMDNDDLRRGKPTCHKAYDEATAILAGDSLQALAFYVLAHDQKMNVAADQRIHMIERLASVSGSRGMAGGQAIDLAAVGKTLSIAELENMHLHKTGALIKASVEFGALSTPRLEPDLLHRISHYAECIGLVFQVRDDILDIEGDTNTLGKPQGSDLKNNKPTYPNLLGFEGAQKTAEKLHGDAIASLSVFDGKADPLRWIADYIVERSY